MMEEKDTKGVRMLLGDPKRAVLLMSLPMIVSLIAQSANNIIDSAWVSELGPDALAAVGFIFPLYFVLIGIGNGIGIGASSAVARHIGQGNKGEADRAAMQSIVISVILGSVAMALMLIFQEPMIVAIGAGDDLDDCLQYSTPILVFSLIFVLNGLFSNLLRAEGMANRSMVTQILAAVFNMILDPILIFDDIFVEVFNVDIGVDIGLGMGLAGGALGTVIAVGASLGMMLYWYIVKKDTFVTLDAKYIPFHKETDLDILDVGIPAACEMLLTSLIAIAMSYLMVMSSEGTAGVAIYSTSWKVIDILKIPLIAVGGAITPVMSAAYGAKHYEGMRVAYMFSLKTCLVMMTVLVVLAELTADYIVTPFTYSGTTTALRDDMVDCLRILFLFLPLLSWSHVATGLFQAIGKGLNSFICTLVRNGLQLVSTGILVSLTGSFTSIMWGVVFARITGSLLTGVWSYSTLKRIERGDVISERGTYGSDMEPDL